MGPAEPEAQPAHPYAAKFSTPFCIAVGYMDGRAGLGQFTEDRIRDPDLLALCRKIRYRVDPDNEYPRNFTGHLRATLHDGSVHEFRQPHMRGGARDPLVQAEIEAKFHDNCRFGGWDDSAAAALHARLISLFEQPDLTALKEFRI